MSYIKERAKALAQAQTIKADGVFIGVELHPSDRSFEIFHEGRVLDADENYIIVDVRRTLKVLAYDHEIAIPGILTLKIDEYTDDNGFLIEGNSIFITD